jgi:hypothetical protein
MSNQAISRTPVAPQANFCSNCGAKSPGKFCSECGTNVSGPTLAIEPLDVLPVDDWADEVRYSILLHFAEVRDEIARFAAQAKKGLSAEEFLKACDLAFKPLTGVSLSQIATIAAPISSRLGIRMEKKRNWSIKRPIGKVLVATLCSMARHGQTLKNVQQAQDGCIFEATVPSDIWSFAGEFVVSIHRDTGRTHVEGSVKIPGQLYDWGKSQQSLDRLYQDLQTLLVHSPSEKFL